jgi:alpha-mannosidase II
LKRFILLDKNDHVLKISTLIHLNMNKDTELALRLSTGIKNGAEFFTDLNGFQMIRRKTYDKLPLQGNVYPMPTMAYIEDDYMRFTILASQPSGVGCLKTGKFFCHIYIQLRIRNPWGF